MRKFLYWLCVLIYLGGAVVFALPDLYRWKVQFENQSVISDFEEEYEKQVESPEKKDDGDDAKEGVSRQLYNKMQEYNENIFRDGQSQLRDPWSFQQEVIDLESYGITDGVIGVISIPKMKVELPIYLGAKEESMAKGAVLLSQTSFPVNGENSNSVIAAHRGWKGSPMFRDIEALELGDLVTVRNPWEILEYRVTDIRVIMPDDIEEILIREGKNMVTLVTCHPYTSNSRRYVVFCEKESVETEAGTQTEQSAEQEDISSIPEPESAEEVRQEARAEDSKQIAWDVSLRKVGYVVIVLFGILIIISGRRRADRK